MQSQEIFFSIVRRHEPLNAINNHSIRQFFRSEQKTYARRFVVHPDNYPVNFGREMKRADIAVMDADHPTTPYIIVEVKKPKFKDGKEQLRSYCKIKDIRSYNARGTQPEYVADGAFSIINSKHILESSLDYDGFEKASSNY